MDQDIPLTSLSRRDIRSLILHVLYVAEAYDYSLSATSIVEMLNTGYELNLEIDGEIFKIASGIIQEREALDALIVKHLVNWRIDRVGCCTLLILRMALWEILHTKTDHIIVINEAIELAKCFSEKDAYKFVNGLLDEYVKRLEIDMASHLKIEKRKRNAKLADKIEKVMNEVVEQGSDICENTETATSAECTEKIPSETKKKRTTKKKAAVDQEPPKEPSDL
jgi:N utilization substance protein B